MRLRRNSYKGTMITVIEQRRRRHRGHTPYEVIPVQNCYNSHRIVLVLQQVISRFNGTLMSYNRTLQTLKLNKIRDIPQIMCR